MSRLKCCTVLFALATAACGSSTAPETPPVDVPITDVYQGSLNKNGADRYSFVTAKAGGTTATLTALSPDSTIVVSLALGTFNSSNGTCMVALANDRATLNSFVSGQSDRAGNLCVRISDVGNVEDPVAYTIQVVHF